MKMLIQEFCCLIYDPAKYDHFFMSQYIRLVHLFCQLQEQYKEVFFLIIQFYAMAICQKYVVDKLTKET